MNQQNSKLHYLRVFVLPNKRILAIHSVEIGDYVELRDNRIYDRLEKSLYAHCHSKEVRLLCDI